MNIRDFFGMPLRYAKSSLEKENIPYKITYTESGSRFFSCDPAALYVVRAEEKDGIVRLLVNRSMGMSDSVRAVLEKKEN